MEVEKSKKEVHIDDALYSRQLYVMGHEAMKKMGSTDVLLVGVDGLGVEIAKDVILTGVKSLTLYDPTPATKFDMGSQYYITEHDIGKPRDQTSVAKLAELNNYVDVQVFHGQFTEEGIKRFKVVVLANQSLARQLQVSEWCRKHQAALIIAETRGVFSKIFCDFGEKHEVIDKDGEQPAMLLIANISQENPGVVTLLEDHKIPFEDGEWVSFSEVQGMTQLNGSAPRKIKILSHYTFSIEDTTGYSPYKSGGYVIQSKQPEFLSFLSFPAAMEEPKILTADFAKMDRELQLHLAFRAIHGFHEKHNRFPQNEADTKEFISIAAGINEITKSKVEKIDEALFTTFSRVAQGSLSPMEAVIGGIASQEVLKACSGKFTPLQQFLYFDATEVLPKDSSDLSNFAPIGSRYDSQIVVLGQKLQQQIQDLHYFLVGSGAIGCEVLKLWAMMGLGSKSGHIHVTDMDLIEKSNLSRQFLFRPKDIEHLKSKTAAQAVLHMNPELHITSYSTRVGPESEELFNPEFYHRLTGVCNALDNVEARLYMDQQCVFYKKPLLESGTLGTKGNTQVVVPNLTESYGSSRDPPEKTVPMCTLHHFPNVIEHAIQWSRDVFEGYFKNQLDQAQSYLTLPTFMDSLDKGNLATKIDTLSSICTLLVDQRPTTWADCLLWSRARFEEMFNHNIQQLLFNFPPDMITSSGAPFWSGPKRAPKPIQFQVENELHMNFVISGAVLRAVNFGIKPNPSVLEAQPVLARFQAKPFVPRKDVKISTNENENNSNNSNNNGSNNSSSSMEDEDQTKLTEILKKLPGPTQFPPGLRLQPIDFEKDDDSNFHMDFITAAANLRAANYSIPLTNKHKAKGIAGKIIPAMVTTTAIVSGLVCLELFKLIQKDKELDQFKNGFINLALPFFGFSEPLAPPKTKVREGWTWNLWDRFEVVPPNLAQGQEFTLKQFIEHFKDKYQLEVSMISSGASMLYSFFMAKDKLADRMGRPLSEVVHLVSKQPLPVKKNLLTFEIVANRIEDDEEVDVPFVVYQFRK